MLRSLSSSCIRQLSRPLGTRGIIHASQRGAEETYVNFDELELNYALIKNPKEIKVVKNNMWTEPPLEQPENLPFAVERTEVGKSLPVYTDYKGGGTKVTTMIRRIRGDVHALKEDMEKVCDDREVHIRPGKLVVDGNYHSRIKLWLSALGF